MVHYLGLPKEWNDVAKEFERKINRPFDVNELRNYVRETYGLGISCVKLGRKLVHPDIMRNGNVYSVLGVQVAGKYEDTHKPKTVVAVRECPPISSWPPMLGR